MNNLPILEKTVEKYLTIRVKAAGGLSFKWASPSLRGVPDRIVLLDKRVRFVEVKSLGKKPTPLQQYRHEQLRAAGFSVHVVDSKEAVDELMDFWGGA